MALNSDPEEKLDIDELKFNDFEMSLKKDIIFAIKKDGQHIMILPYDGKLSYIQKPMIDRVIVTMDPSIFLRFCIWIEMTVKFYINFLTKLYENEDE